MKGTKSHSNLIVHDFLATNGGAEKVTLHLAKILENSEILVSYTEKKIFDYKLKNLHEFYKPIGLNFFDFLLIFLKFLSYKTKKTPYYRFKIYQKDPVRQKKRSSKLRRSESMSRSTSFRLF